VGCVLEQGWPLLFSLCVETEPWVCSRMVLWKLRGVWGLVWEISVHRILGQLQSTMEL
jgi:hypothetical protein